MSFKLKCQPKEKLIYITAKILPSDRDLLYKLGNGNMAEGLRMVLFSVREDIKKMMEDKERKKA
jgi:hypothetical protein